MILDLGRPLAQDPAEGEVRRALGWEAPLLPELAAGTVRRWEGAATWIPPETHPLCRHRVVDSEERVVTTGRRPPEGHVLEFDLGVLHRFALPGTRRLVDEGGMFTLSDDQNQLDAERRSLGYVEQAPFPMLEVLELRRMPSTGQHVLVAGAEDPLYQVAEPLAVLGWIEPLPIQPRRLTLYTGAWGVVPLRRRADESAWRHRYWAGPPAGEPDEVTLGGLLPAEGKGLIPLRLRADGRLESDLAGPSRRSASPVRRARWVAAPLSWTAWRPPGWALRATGSRTRHLVLRRGNRRTPAHAATVLGWLRREPALGFSPFFSATHPVTGDQFVTRSEVEAEDLGYRIDGMLGYISDGGADRTRTDQPATILWGSRFGQGRRYVEGMKGS